MSNGKMDTGSETEPTLTETTNPYDETPYPPLSHADTHPDHLAAVATLVGLQPPALDGCRVLEIGAASGGNLIPMAAGLPHSQFVGVDYSTVQVSAANEAVSTLGLDNVRFECTDIRTMDPGGAPFDYIIAHGVYSWVPAEVREALLAACGRLLSPNGVAYVSYNTYPGWHSLEAIRAMMLHGSRDISDPRSRVETATETVQFFQGHAETGSALANHLELYSRLGDARDEMQPSQADALVLHDLLSEHNQPFYYHEFVAHAERHGLAPFADADFPSMFPRGLSDDATTELSKRVGSRVDFEQYLDFFRDRSFRKSLLCRDVSGLQPTIHPGKELMGRLYAHTRAKMEEPYDLPGSGGASLVASSGARVSTDHPLSKAALAELAEAAPSSIGFDDLINRASVRLRVAGGAEDVSEEDVLAIATNLLQGFSYDDQLVDLRTLEAPLAARPSARPQVSDITRYFAARGALTLPNAYHVRVRIEPIHAAIIALLDGTRDRSEVRAELDELVVVSKSPSSTQSSLDGLIDETLSFFSSAALLTA